MQNNETHGNRTCDISLINNIVLDKYQKKNMFITIMRTYLLSYMHVNCYTTHSFCASHIQQVGIRNKEKVVFPPSMILLHISFFKK